MPNLCRVGDINQTGGAIIGGASTVFANGLKVGQLGNQLTPHAPWSKKAHPPHRKATVTSGSPTVFADGIAVARVTSSNSCGHSMAQGSPDVFVE
jgi:uncharacterized Zn-binding protein involved in type VI secretion